MLTSITEKEFEKKIQLPLALLVVLISIILFIGGFFVVGVLFIVLGSFALANANDTVSNESLFVVIAVGCVVLSGWFWIGTPLPGSRLFVALFGILAVASAVRVWKERQWRRERQPAEDQ